MHTEHYTSFNEFHYHGRTLVYATYGRRDGGYPVFFLHGNMQSRLQMPVYEHTPKVTAEAGAFLIAIDRPGFGGSTYMGAREYRDLPPVLDALATHLGFSEYAVVGFSSGGPNALACGAYLPKDRCRVVGSIAGDGPYFTMPWSAVYKPWSFIFLLYAWLPDFLRALLTRVFLSLFCKFFMTQAVKGLGKAYKHVKEDTRRSMLLQDLATSQAQGLLGIVQDMRLEVLPWSFHLADVKCKVMFWHGEKDEMVPVACARWMAHHCRDSTLVVIPNKRHSVFRDVWGDVLKAIVAYVKANPAKGKILK